MSRRTVMAARASSRSWFDGCPFDSGDQPIVFRVRTDPEPRDGISFQTTQRSVFSADSYRIKSGVPAQPEGLWWPVRCSTWRCFAAVLQRSDCIFLPGRQFFKRVVWRTRTGWWERPWVVEFLVPDLPDPTFAGFRIEQS